MPSIKDIAKQLSTTSVRLSSGVVLQVTALTEADVTAIHRILPRPVPPMGKDPGKGSLSASVPIETDPGYQSRLRAWVDRVRRLEVAIAAGLTTEAGRSWLHCRANETFSAEWAAEIDKEILASSLTRFDLMAISEAAAKCAGASFDGDGIEQAEGN